MLFAGSMMSLTVRASQFARGEWLGFIRSIGSGPDAGLNERRLSLGGKRNDWRLLFRLRRILEPTSHIISPTAQATSITFVISFPYTGGPNARNVPHARRQCWSITPL